MPENENSQKGRRGEKYLDILADEAGFTVHKPDDDRHGWDQLWEYQADDDGTPLDRRAGIVNVFVQAKTTDSRTYEDVKLDVMERAAKDPRPFFFAFVVRGANRKPADFYLLHVKEQTIGETLKRLIEADIDGAREKIHKKKVRLHRRDGHRIAPDDADGLRNYILAEVGDPATYTKTKQQIVDTIGTEHGGHSATFTLAPGVSDEAVVDLLIGARPSVPISMTEIFRRRFGLEISVAKYVDPGVLELRPSSRGIVPVSLVRDDGKRVEVLLDVYLPPAVVPLDQRKVRLANEVLEMIIVPGREEISISLVCPNRRALDDLATARDILDLLDRDASGLSLEAMTPKGIWTGQGVVPRMAVSPSLDRALCGAVASLKLARHLGFRVENEQVWLKEMERLAGQMDSIASGLGVVEGEGRVRLKNSATPILDQPKAVFLMDFPIPLVKHVLILVASVSGRPERMVTGNDVYTIVKGVVTAVQSRRFTRGERCRSQISEFRYEVLRSVHEREPSAPVFPVWWRNRSIRDDEIAKLSELQSDDTDSSA